MFLSILLVASPGGKGSYTAISSSESDSVPFIQATDAWKTRNDSVAAELFLMVAKEFPNSERAPDALYYVGTLFYKENYPSAISAFRMYIEQFPQGKQLNEVTHWTGMCYYGMEGYLEAIGVFSEELDRFPNSEFTGDALRFTGMCYIMPGDTARGNEILRSVSGEAQEVPEYWFRN